MRKLIFVIAFGAVFVGSLCVIANVYATVGVVAIMLILKIVTGGFVK